MRSIFPRQHPLGARRLRRRRKASSGRVCDAAPCRPVCLYRAAFLRRYADLEPSPIEHWEALEQLRALWHGYRIRVLTIDGAPPGCRYAGGSRAGAQGV